MRGRWGYLVIGLLFLIGLASGLSGGLMMAGMAALGVALAALVVSFFRPAARSGERRKATATAVVGLVSLVGGGALAPAPLATFAQPAPVQSPSVAAPSAPPSAPVTTGPPAESSAQASESARAEAERLATAAKAKAAAKARAEAKKAAAAAKAKKAAAAKAKAKKVAAAKKAAAAKAKKKAAAARKAAARKSASTYYENCDAVRAAGAAPIHAGDPGYSRKLDRDGDGIGCE